MSFDVYFQRSVSWHLSPVDMEAVRAALDPFLEWEEHSGFAKLATSDGEADVYGLTGEDGFMVNHASGSSVWGVLVDVSIATDLVIMPVGCPICLTSSEQLGELPAELRTDTVVIESGDDLLRTITGI